MLFALFWHPSNRAQSEIVYCDALPKGKLIEEMYSGTTSADEESVDDVDFKKEDSGAISRKDFYNSDAAYIIYHAAKILQSVLSEVSTMIPWPPSALGISEAKYQHSQPGIQLLSIDSCGYLLIMFEVLQFPRNVLFCRVQLSRKSFHLVKILFML